MKKKFYGFRFSEEVISLVDQYQESNNLSTRTEALRHLIKTYAQPNPNQNSQRTTQQEKKKICGFRLSEETIKRLDHYAKHFTLSTRSEALRHIIKTEYAKIQKKKQGVKTFPSIEEEERWKLNEKVLRWYKFLKQQGYSGSLNEFINDSIEDYFKGRGMVLSVTS